MVLVYHYSASTNKYNLFLYCINSMQLGQTEKSKVFLLSKKKTPLLASCAAGYTAPQCSVFSEWKQWGTLVYPQAFSDWSSSPSDSSPLHHTNALNRQKYQFHILSFKYIFYLVKVIMCHTLSKLNPSPQISERALGTGVMGSTEGRLAQIRCL